MSVSREEQNTRAREGIQKTARALVEQSQGNENGVRFTHQQAVDRVTRARERGDAIRENGNR